MLSSKTLQGHEIEERKENRSLDNSFSLHNFDWQQNFIVEVEYNWRQCGHKWRISFMLIVRTRFVRNTMGLLWNCYGYSNNNRNLRSIVHSCTRASYSPCLKVPLASPGSHRKSISVQSNYRSFLITRSLFRSEYDFIANVSSSLQDGLLLLLGPFWFLWAEILLYRTYCRRPNGFSKSRFKIFSIRICRMVSITHQHPFRSPHWIMVRTAIVQRGLAIFPPQPMRDSERLRTCRLEYIGLQKIVWITDTVFRWSSEPWSIHQNTGQLVWRDGVLNCTGDYTSTAQSTTWNDSWYFHHSSRTQYRLYRGHRSEILKATWSPSELSSRRCPTVLENWEDALSMAEIDCANLYYPTGSFIDLGGCVQSCWTSKE